MASPDKSHSPTGAILVSEDPGADNVAILRHQRLQVLEEEGRLGLLSLPPPKTTGVPGTQKASHCKEMAGITTCSKRHTGRREGGENCPQIVGYREKPHKSSHPLSNSTQDTFKVSQAPHLHPASIIYLLHHCQRH